MIKKISIYHLRIPFQFQISHNLAKRTYGESILVIAEDENGILGYGEGTPREYVTGETINKSCSAAELLAPELSTLNFDSKSEYIQSLERIGHSDISKSFPSAWCAIELACLDLFGQKNGIPLGSIFSDSPTRNEFEYSAVIPMMPFSQQDAILNLIAKNQIQYIKIKVDDVEDGVSRIQHARDKLGYNVNIRVDANAAFSLSQSIDFLNKVKKFSISALEQPVVKESLSAFHEIKSMSDGVLILADESINTLQDATELIGADSCHGFNIRLSKCGGIINCLKLCQLADENKLRYQIGCHVGESNILSAAGRHFASHCADYLFLEGSFSKYMLVDDITNEEISFGFGGKANLTEGPGLGVVINFEKLNKWGELKNTIILN